MMRFEITYFFKSHFLFQEDKKLSKNYFISAKFSNFVEFLKLRELFNNIKKIE